eukprot:2946074-Pleurochrysis_carterae.AAC.1
MPITNHTHARGRARSERTRPRCRAGERRARAQDARASMLHTRPSRYAHAHKKHDSAAVAAAHTHTPSGALQPGPGCRSLHSGGWAQDTAHRARRVLRSRNRVFLARCSSPRPADVPAPRKRARKEGNRHATKGSGQGGILKQVAQQGRWAWAARSEQRADAKKKPLKVGQGRRPAVHRDGEERVERRIEKVNGAQTEEEKLK